MRAEVINFYYKVRSTSSATKPCPLQSILEFCFARGKTQWWQRRVRISLGTIQESFVFLFVCLGMVFEICSGDECFPAHLALMRFILCRDVGEVMPFPSMGKFQRLLFTTNLTDDHNFHVGVIEIFKVL